MREAIRKNICEKALRGTTNAVRSTGRDHSLSSQGFQQLDSSLAAVPSWCLEVRKTREADKR